MFLNNEVGLVPVYISHQFPISLHIGFWAVSASVAA